jgi:signal transduction histidine kinase
VDGDAVLCADPVRLRQAVGNLVINVLRHTGSGGVTVQVRPDGGGLVIEVTDAGAGMGAQDLPLVFDRFWRAEKSRSRRPRSSGWARRRPQAPRPMAAP